MLKRLFDIGLSFIGVLFLLPVFLVIGVAILVNSGAPIFYVQQRMGKHQVPFNLLKFRSMKTDNSGMKITVSDDPRITSIGRFIRKYKLDELPQLFNILKGDMSFVGPRPEVEKYVNLYTEEQLQVLSVKPGLTGLDSLNFSNESELLEGKANPEEFYINDIMPKKISLNLDYVNSHSIGLDLKIMLKTAKKVFIR